jgi:hypothetical protein
MLLILIFWMLYSTLFQTFLVRSVTMDRWPISRGAYWINAEIGYLRIYSPSPHDGPSVQSDWAEPKIQERGKHIDIHADPF